MAVHAPPSPTLLAEMADKLSSDPPSSPGRSERRSSARLSHSSRSSLPGSGEQLLGRSLSMGTMATPFLSKKYADSDALYTKRLGVTAEQVKREQALRRLGVREDDLEVAQALIRQRNSAGSAEGLSTKEEMVMGHSRPQIARAKALALLGVTEDVVDEEHSKNLGALGLGARKRSFVDKTQDTLLSQYLPRMSDLPEASRLSVFDDHFLHGSDVRARATMAAARQAGIEERATWQQRSMRKLQNLLMGDAPQLSYGELLLMHNAAVDQRNALEERVHGLEREVARLSTFIRSLGFEPDMSNEEEDEETTASGAAAPAAAAPGLRVDLHAAGSVGQPGSPVSPIDRVAHAMVAAVAEATPPRRPSARTAGTE